MSNPPRSLFLFNKENPQHLFFFGFLLFLKKKRPIESNVILPIDYIVLVLWLNLPRFLLSVCYVAPEDDNLLFIVRLVSFIHLIFDWYRHFPSNRIIHLFPFYFSQSQFKSGCATRSRENITSRRADE